MATQRILMGGKEFVEKVIDGERDFFGIKLEEGFDLAGYKGFSVMQDYLKKQDLESNPVDITHSVFRYVSASGLYLPHVKGVGIDLSGADLIEANLSGADLCGAHLSGANLIGAELSDADLNSANLAGADLCGARLFGANLSVADLAGANISGANLSGANLMGTCLRHVYNLECAEGLGHAAYFKTKVTEKEKAIIEKALEGRNLFDVEEESITIHDMNYRIGKFGIGEGGDGKFIVVIEGDDLVFYAESASKYHKDIATRNGLNPENVKHVSGGGLIGLNSSEEAVLYSASASYGGVPRRILEGFRDIILDEYRRINPAIKRVVINPNKEHIGDHWKPILEKLNSNEAI